MYYLGIDLGGTNIAVGLTDENGKILSKQSVKTGGEREPQEIIRDMGELCIKVCKDYGISLSEVAAAGIGIPGTLDSKEGVIVYTNNINLSQTPIVKLLQQYIDMPIYISNDANCAAFGEFVDGAAKNYDSSVMVTLGTGVGGGIILNGKLWEGLKSAGAEIGHMVLHMDGEPCTCGRNGCWEAYSSATALIRDTRRQMDNNPDSLMHQIAAEEGKVSGKTAFMAAKKGDAAGKSVVDNYITYLAEGIANVINLLAPDVVLIGGGVSNEGDYLLTPLKQQVYRKCYGGEELVHSEIKVASLGNDAGIVGAAMLYRNQE